MPIELRLAEDEVDAVLIFRTLKEMHDEGCVPGSFDPVKTLTNVLRIVNGPASVALMAMEGEELAGVLLLMEDGYWWSSTDRCITDKALYIRQDHRDGDALKVLLSAAKDTSNDCKLPVYITLFNQQRRRGGGSKWERLGATLGFTPRGAVLAHFPEN